jgi:riboflavin transporter FmnP
MKIKTSEIIIASYFSAISAVFQIVHVVLPLQWGMWIDLVGIPWIAAYFLVGFKAAFLTAVLTSIIITLVAPSTAVGAILKFAATVPMFLVPALLVKTMNLKINDLGKIHYALIALALSLVLRVTLVLPLNYFFAIPFWTGLSTEVALQTFPPQIIEFFNVVQGIVEFSLAWYICFKTRLRRLI